MNIMKGSKAYQGLKLFPFLWDSILYLQIYIPFHTLPGHKVFHLQNP